MSAISLRIPKSIHKKVREMARREGVSKKLSALMTTEYLEERAKRGDRKKFERALYLVKDREPSPEDKL